MDPVTGVVNGDLIAKPAADPARAGFSFGGWHKEAAGTNAWDFDADTVTGNTTLYAKWEFVPVTDIVNVSVDGILRAPDLGVLDLGVVTVDPPNASVKTIRWALKSAGTTGAVLAGNKVTVTAIGTLILTATVVNGNEDAAGNLSNYTEAFSFTVGNASAGGGVSLGDDTSVRLYANGAAEPLPADGTVTIAKDAVYYLDIGTDYSNIVWRLNGQVSSVTDRTIYLDTKTAGTVVVTVEAEKSGVKDGGAYTVIIK